MLFLRLNITYRFLIEQFIRISLLTILGFLEHYQRILISLSFSWLSWRLRSWLRLAWAK